MAYEVPCVPVFAFYILTLHVVYVNSRTSSTHWKLTPEGKIQSSMVSGDIVDDPLMNILTKKIAKENDFDGCAFYKSEESIKVIHEAFRPKEPPSEIPEENERTNNDSVFKTKSQRERTELKPPPTPVKTPKKLTPSCGKAVNYTSVDGMKGISDRHHHPNHPEPDLVTMFQNRNGDGNVIDLNKLAKRLKKERKENPRSSLVYNEIGNFWRIIGDTGMAIECFRKALHYKPRSVEVLLDLARVLFNLKYYDDAIELTKMSLAYLSRPQNSWFQHFTLGEIHKSIGLIDEAVVHFENTLRLNPGFQPAEVFLQEMQSRTNATVSFCTALIIVTLILTVLMLFNVCMTDCFEDVSSDGSQRLAPRHFNRAMAMRSMKLGINHRLQKMRKLTAAGQT